MFGKLAPATANGALISNAADKVHGGDSGFQIL